MHNYDLLKTDGSMIDANVATEFSIQVEPIDPLDVFTISPMRPLPVSVPSDSSVNGNSFRSSVRKMAHLTADAPRLVSDKEIKALSKIEYQIIPLREADDRYNLTENRPKKTNSKGQTIGFDLSRKHGPGYYGPVIDEFYDPITNKFVALPLGPFSARLITDTGYVAGCRDNRGYVWNYETGKTDFFEINAQCNIFALNNQGDVLFSSVFRKGYDQARIFTANKEIIKIESLEGCARGTAMNDSLQVVGGTGGYMGWPNVRAFIWDQNNGMRYLSDLIAKDSGWYLRMATYINNEGLIIGEGTYNGVPSEFLLIPKKL